MAKAPRKKSLKDERVKLDMSFEDALRLAAKTKPPVTIELELNKQELIWNASGKIIQLGTIEIYGNQGEKFSLHAKRIAGLNTRTKSFEMHHSITDKLSDNIFRFKNAIVDVADNEILFIQINPSQNHPNEVFDKCKLTYWLNEHHE